MRIEPNGQTHNCLNPNHGADCKVRLSESAARERIERHLQLNRERWTQTRELILEACFRQSGPFSVSSLHQGLQSQRQSSPDWATVSRTLQYFKRVGVVHEADFDGEQQLYEIASQDETHHHHYVICKNCERRTLLPECNLAPLIQNLTHSGYVDLSHSLVIRGTCPECHERRSR